MDLRETYPNGMRHPWETSRLTMIRRILKKHLPKNTAQLKVLDVGCGDGWLARHMLSYPGIQAVHGLDIFLPDKDVHPVGQGSLAFVNKQDQLSNDYGLILLLDVLEHMEHDTASLKDIADLQALPGAIFLITVPAYNALYTSHDTFLRHFRRYNRKMLHSTVKQAGLDILDEGAMFSSLIIPCALFCLKEKLFPPRKDIILTSSPWPHGLFLTKTIETFLNLDNNLLFLLNRFNMPTAGLTRWAVARKRL